MGNVKTGDLAVVIKTGPHSKGCLGKIVTIGEPIVSDRGYEAWTYHPTLYSDGGRLIQCVEDQCLRPIRDNDGEDEMLRIAGKPKTKEKTK